MPETLPLEPNIESSSEWVPITLRVEFGDGYSERVSDGPQEFRDNWTLVFKNLTPSEWETLGGFLREHGSRTAFYWAPPWDAGTSAKDPNTKSGFKRKLWTFVDGSLRQSPQFGTGEEGEPGLTTLSVQIQQEFDIVA